MYIGPAHSAIITGLLVQQPAACTAVDRGTHQRCSGTQRQPQNCHLGACQVRARGERIMAKFMRAAAAAVVLLLPPPAVVGLVSRPPPAVDARRQALMTIFNDTGGPGWGGHQGRGNRGWAGSGDPCTWAGVCCKTNATAFHGCRGADTTEVTGLDLGFNNLSGTLPPDPAVWAALPQLRFLSARSNRLSGSLPTAMRLLTQVEDLNLRRNLFSGTLPSAWGPLQRLQHFSISVVNFISGSIPASFGSMRLLGEGPHGGLDLTNNRLHGRIPATLSSLRNFHDCWPGQGGNIGLGVDSGGNVYVCPVPPITLSNGTVTTTYAHCGRPPPPPVVHAAARGTNRFRRL